MNDNELLTKLNQLKALCLKPPVPTLIKSQVNKYIVQFQIIETIDAMIKKLYQA